MLKIAFILPYAPIYREAIYRKIDETFDVDWYFCDNSGHGLKQMDYSAFKNAKLCLHESLFRGHSFWYKGLSSIPVKKYDYLFIAGQTHCPAEWYLLMRYGHKSHGPKVCLWTHGWYGKESNLEKKLKRIFYHFADKIFLYGNRARNLMIKEGYDEHKLFTIHNSLAYDEQFSLRKQMQSSDVYKKHFGNEYPVMIFLGRLTPVKQLNIAIDSLANLRDRRKCFNLVFVGDGSERATLESLVVKYGLQKQVWFYGACYDEMTNAELVYNADLCVAPGNIGLTAMHSMMFGCPCITHNDFKWQMPEFEAIHEWKTGAFFTRNDAKSLSNAIENWFYIHKEDREDVRKACYEEIDTQWNPYCQIEVLKKNL